MSISLKKDLEEFELELVELKVAKAALADLRKVYAAVHEHMLDYSLLYLLSLAETRLQEVIKRGKGLVVDDAD